MNAVERVNDETEIGDVLDDESPGLDYVSVNENFENVDKAQESIDEDGLKECCRRNGSIRGPVRPKIVRSCKSGRSKKVYNQLNCVQSMQTPQTVTEALGSTECDEWRTAM